MDRSSLRCQAIFRCQRFNFRRIPTSQIATHLEMIARAEGLEAEDDAVYLLAQRADGALRDAESLMDQVASFERGKVTAAGVRLVLGLVDGDVFFELTAAFVEGSASKALDLFAAVVDEGGDAEEFLRGLVEHMRYLLFAKVQAAPTSWRSPTARAAGTMNPRRPSTRRMYSASCKSSWIWRAI